MKNKIIGQKVYILIKKGYDISISDEYESTWPNLQEAQEAWEEEQNEDIVIVELEAIQVFRIEKSFKVVKDE